MDKSTKLRKSPTLEDCVGCESGIDSDQAHRDEDGNYFSGCVVKEPCQGCIDLENGTGGENQLAHMGFGGCLYEPFTDEEIEDEHEVLVAKAEQKSAIEALETYGSGFHQSEIQKKRAKILHSEELELEKRESELAKKIDT